MDVSGEKTSLLDQIYIASPCTVPWDDMPGSERVRDCGLCRRQVFNISDMSKTEAEAFLQENGSSKCLALYRRQDGTILTDDCPVGLRKIRNTLRRVKHAASFVITAIISMGAAFAQNNPAAANSPQKPPPQRIQVTQTLGMVCAPKVSTVPPISKLKEGKYGLKEELFEKDGNLFLRITESPAKDKRESTSDPSAWPVPAEFYAFDAHKKGLAYDELEMPKTAEAFYKLALKILEGNPQDASDVKANIIGSYKDLLIKTKRTKEAGQIDLDFQIPKE